MAYTEVTKDNLESLVENSAMLVIDFWAEWCGPCKAFGPIFEKVADRYPDITFAKCDTEVERDDLAAQELRKVGDLFHLACPSGSRFGWDQADGFGDRGDVRVALPFETAEDGGQPNIQLA